jgi:AraC-like DNA-binding protein
VTSIRPERDTTLSIRLLWPFTRVLGSDPRGRELLARTGLPSMFSDPDARVSHFAAMQMLETLAEEVAEPGFGLRAGAQMDPADFDVVEHVARAMSTLGEAMNAMARYIRILHDAAEITITPVSGDLVEWRYRVTDGVRQPAAASEFCVAAALGFSYRNTATYEAPVEVRFIHDPPSHAADYARLCNKVTFNARETAIVIRRERLEVPLLRASRPLSSVFAGHAQRLLDELRHRESVSGRVRAEVASQLRKGAVSMQAVARRLAMSAATLRRRLEAEGSTFSDIVDQLRRDLAVQYLCEPGTGISEAAFLLGFSSVTAFTRAFRRWKGVSPTEYRNALAAPTEG